MTMGFGRRGVSRAVCVVALALAGAATVQAQSPLFEPPARIPTDIEALKHLFETGDPVKFLADRAKPLKLGDVQRDTLKKLEQGLKRLRGPLLKRLERELPESLLPGQQAEVASLPTATRVLVDSLSRSTGRFEELAWSQLDEAQRAQALELRANWRPPTYTPSKRAYRVNAIGGPP